MRWLTDSMDSSPRVSLSPFNSKQKEREMKKVLFTSKVEEAMTFNSFGAATASGEANLGTGMFRVDGKGGIHLVVTHPSMSGVVYVKDIVS